MTIAVTSALAAPAVVAAATLLLWVALDRRRAAFALGLTVGTNASAVIEREYGVQGFLLPLALVVVAVAVVRAVRERTVPRQGHAAGVAVVGLVFLAAALGPFVSDDPALSAVFVQQLVRDMILVAAGVAVASRADGLRAGLAGVGAAGALLATVTVVQFLTTDRSGTAGGFGAWTVQGLADLGPVARAAGPFVDDPNAYAQYLLVAAAALAGLAATADVARRRWVLGALGALVVAGMILTRSRSGLLGLVVVAAVWVWATQPRRRAIGISALGLVLLTLSPLAGASRLTTLAQAGRPEAAADTSIAGRTSEAASAVRMFTDHPLTGVGFGTYPSEYLEYARGIGLDTRFETRSAHSLPLEIAAEQGIVGVAAWAVLVVFAVSTARRAVRRRPDVGVPLSLALGALAVTSVFLHDVHPRLMWLLVAMVVGASWWLLDPPRRSVPDPGPGTVAPVARRDPRLLVAMVIQNYVPALGGAERQLASVAPLLVARGVRPVVVTRAMAGRPTEDEVDGIRVVRVPVSGPKAVRSALFVRRAARVLAALQPDVVHAFDTLTPSVVALRHRRRFATPVAVKLLRSGPLGDLHRILDRPAGAARRRRLLAEVDVFVSISADIDAELDELGVAAARRARIPNGVDARRFHPRRSRQGSSRRPTAVVAGRLAPEKRVAELARRWVRVTEAVPAARLVVVGDGPERDRIVAAAGDRAVELVGRSDDVPRLLRTADVYVSCSAAEGLSNSLLEAMASGLACVVTDVGGVRDVITHGVDGVVVAPDDLDGVADAVAELLGDPVRRRELGVAARRRAREQCSLAVTADRLAALYLEMANGRAAPEGAPVDDRTREPAGLTGVGR